MVNKDESCNCRKRETCPLDEGKCRAENAIYKATIKTDNSSKLYIGQNANQLKKLYQHNNKKQTKRKKLPLVQISNWTFKIKPQIKKWKQELKNKLENTAKGKNLNKKQWHA